MKTKLLLSISSVAILLTAGCGGGPEFVPAHPLQLAANPIIGGTTDSGDPAVGVLYNSAQGYLCSGTLIAPKVFLTAGHCTGEPFDGTTADYQIAGGTDPFNQGASWISSSITSVQAHPQYSGSPNYDHDVGIVVIGGYMSGSQVPAALTWQQAVNDSVYAAGTQFKAVGYGITSGSGQDSGIKRTTQLKISQPYSDVFIYGDYNQSQTQTHNTCSGDSGGPAIAANGSVIGTVSFGDQNCQYFGADQRTDYNASFIGQFAPGGGGGTPNPTPSPTPNHTPTPDPSDTPAPKKIFGMDVPKVGCSVTFGDDAASALPALLALGLGIALARRKRA